MSRESRLPILVLLGILTLSASPLTSAAEPRPANSSAEDRSPEDRQPRKIVLIAGPKSHGPVGNGIHDYPWSVKLIKVMLDNSNVADRVRVEYHLDGWPQNPATLNDADTIMVVSDGRDGDKFIEAPHFHSREHRDLIAKQMARGCGFVTFHFSTFAPDTYAADILDWNGAYFDWETNNKRQWYSAIQTLDTDVQLASPRHPIARGVSPFRLKEEFYFNLRFRTGDKSVTPILSVPALPGREPDGRIVAWARERPDGGRGFGTTCGHFYDNWRNDAFRRTILNALVWSAHVEVPQGGVESRYYTHAEITAAIAGRTGTGPAIVDDRPIKVLILTGNQHPGHKWQETTPAIKVALERDPRMKVEVSEKIEDLATDKIHSSDLLVLNYCNWKQPGLSDAAKANFVKYLKSGGGLCLIHFANGAFHHSLPEAADSDWPEFRNICRRVWDHTPGKSGHDAYGKFLVEIESGDHPITAGLEAFQTTDELYFRQQGESPITVLAKARSQVTGQFEPMAFVYDYGKGRVFQTVLGHAVESVNTPGTSELIRRAAAWVARRPQVAGGPLVVQNSKPGSVSTADAQPAAPKPAAGSKPAATPKKGALALHEAGKFGKGIDARQQAVHVVGKAEYQQLPLTVECWAKLRSSTDYNILVANDLKSSPHHWEIFTMAGTGYFTAYLPDRRPDHVHSTVNICDDRWHHLAMIYEANRVRLFIDGQQVANHPVLKRVPKVSGKAAAPKTGKGTAAQPNKPADKPESAKTPPGLLGIGRLASGGLGCDGLIDEVRISKGTLKIAGLPDKPFTTGETTLGLWHFDQLVNAAVPDDSLLKNPAKAGLAQAAAANEKITGHWGEDAVGFRWTEKDSVDNRWNQADIGPFLASIIPLPKLPPVAKGMSIRVGDQQQATVCYDTENLTLRAAWTGGFLTFNPARFGIINSPQPVGEMLFASAPLKGMSRTGHGDSAGNSGSAEADNSAAGKNTADKAEPSLHYQGFTLNNGRVVFQYQFGGTKISESPWVETHAGELAISRSLSVGPSGHALALPVFAGQAKLETEAGLSIVTVPSAGKTLAFAVTGSHARLEVHKEQVRLTFPASTETTHARLYYWSGSEDKLPAFRELVRKASAPTTLEPLTRPGSPQWTADISTQGRLGNGTGPYVLDTLTLPFNNPYRALLFVSGHGFFSNGDMAISTLHGDVWRVSGVDDSLRKLTWKRFATGLFQPLGLKVIDDTVHVLGRNQITRLHDRNHDGEADFYECFFQGHVTSPGGHDFVTCLETDTAGNFYYVHATQGLIRVARDGSRLDVVATGFRNPNGMGVGPQNVLTVSPQEGHWTPASSIFEAHPGSYHGFGGPKITDDRPLGYDPPLCWIPRLMDNSSGGQAWVTSDSWGPLKGQLLHFSYGKCHMMLVPREVVDGQAQGGIVEFPLDFESGVCRGRFSPHDGQLYVSGLRGWTSAAVQDGCLQRVRYTGRPVDMPVAVRTLRNGLALTYSRALDRESAERPDNYALLQWNYRYGKQYGSRDYRVSNPKAEGRDEVDVLSATLLDDRTVFLELKDVQPVMQTSISCTIAARDGTPIRQTLVYTINRVRNEQIDPARLIRRSSPTDLPPEIVQNLEPGVVLQFSQPAGVKNTGVTSTGTKTGKAKIGSLIPGSVKTDSVKTDTVQASGGQPGTAAPVRTDARQARLLAVHVPAGTAPTPFLEPGPFHLMGEGYLRVPLKGEFHFHLEGTGTAELSINGVSVLKAEGDLSRQPPVTVALHKGYNRVAVEYRSPDRKDAALRLMWGAADFPDEPVPSTLLWHDRRNSELTTAGLLRQGRVLFTTHQCSRCHTEPAAIAVDSTGTYNLGHRSLAVRESGNPSLKDVGSRLSSRWMYHWLLNPASVRNDAQMPRLFDASPESRQAAADIAAWLATLGTSPESDLAAATAIDTAMLKTGATLFADLGCIACHRTTPPDEADEYNRISLHYTATKFASGALKGFIRAPHAHHSRGRMPDFHLTADEASALAAHLLAVSKGSFAAAAEFKTASPARGKELFRTQGCGNCHTVDDRPQENVKRLPSVFQRGATGGCLAERQSLSPVPRYNFTPDDRQALAAFLATEGRSLAHSSPPEMSRHLFTHLRCAACHPRDDQPSPRAEIYVDETGTGLIPEPLPSLTWAGEKLRPQWIRQLLGGRTPPSRLWLKARMPAFPAFADPLATGLAAEHGLGQPAQPPRRFNPDLAAIGSQLSQKSTGLDCRQCHGVGPLQPLGDKDTKIAPGINFALIPDRLRHDFYSRFVFDPPRYDIGTKMPKLVVDSQTTKIRQYYDGDARKQFEALWHYIQSVERPGEERQTGGSQ